MILSTEGLYLAPNTPGPLRAAIKINVAGNHDPYDLLILVVVLVRGLWILLIDAMVEMYFSGTTFNNDIAAV
ncbi:MAG TPA: hypothetical protein VFH01_06940 [Pyrinomonadaceae bacterium]|nr:hypothetical protein [Pyrinomonadaceae bacterium]